MEESSAGGGWSERLLRPLVLVVDDNAINQEAAGVMLEELGLRVHFAPGGREALEAMQARTYAAVFMDCQMPDLDGFETTVRIRQIEGTERHTPVIALTASTLREDRRRCFESGMDDYLSKPVFLDTLAPVLQRWIPGVLLGDEAQESG